MGNEDLTNLLDEVILHLQQRKRSQEENALYKVNSFGGHDCYVF